MVQDYDDMAEVAARRGAELAGQDQGPARTVFVDSKLVDKLTTRERKPGEFTERGALEFLGVHQEIHGRIRYDSALDRLDIMGLEGQGHNRLLKAALKALGAEEQNFKGRWASNILLEHAAPVVQKLTDAGIIDGRANRPSGAALG